MPRITHSTTVLADHHEGSMLLSQQPTLLEDRGSTSSSSSGSDDFADLIDEYLDSDMETSMLQRPRPRRSTRSLKPPAVPQRSEKRRSTENVVVPTLKSLDGSQPFKELNHTIQLQLVDPHQAYLSSEEDASLSEDYESDASLIDFEPLTQDSEAHRSSSQSPTEKRQEITARRISFRAAGKPRIITISPSKRLKTSHSAPLGISNLPETQTSRSSRIIQKGLRRLSISSTTSAYTILSSSSDDRPQTALPPRSSSRGPPSFGSSNTSSSSPEAVSPTQQSLSRNPSLQTTPKTPIAMAASAFKNSVSRTLSKAKRPSLQKLSATYHAGVPLGLDMHHRASRILEHEDEEERPDGFFIRSRAATTPQTPRDGVDLTASLRGARRGGIVREMADARPLASIAGSDPMEEKRFGLVGSGLARRRSVRGRVERYF